MDDLIVGWLNALSAGTTSDVSDLLGAPQEYNPTVFRSMSLLHNTVVKPVTAIVLAIMASLMLASSSTRADGDRELGVRIIAGTMFKVAMVLIACQNAPLILNALAGVASWMSKGANDIDLAAAGVDSTPLGDQMRAAIEAADPMNQLVMILVLLFPWIASSLGTVVVIVLIFIRFLQMYLLGAFASLPVAFLSHDETKQIGIGYLKRYAVVAISGVVMVLAIKLYQALLAGWLSGQVTYNGEDALPFISENFGTFLIAPIVLIFLMFGANGIAKAIVGEG